MYRVYRKSKGEVNQRKNPQRGQAIHPWPEGPDQVTCTVIQVSTGRTITSVIGRKSKKHSAAGNAKLKALRKTRMSRKWIMMTEQTVAKHLGEFFRMVGRPWRENRFIDRIRFLRTRIRMIKLVYTQM